MLSTDRCDSAATEVGVVGALAGFGVMASTPVGISDVSAATLVPCRKVLRSILNVIDKVQPVGLKIRLLFLRSRNSAQSPSRNESLRITSRPETPARKRSFSPQANTPRTHREHPEGQEVTKTLSGEPDSGQGQFKVARSVKFATAKYGRCGPLIEHEPSSVRPPPRKRRITPIFTRCSDPIPLHSGLKSCTQNA